jgi:hypothetical protein
MAGLSKGCRVRVTDQTSQYRNKWGTVLKTKQGKITVRLDGHRGCKPVLFDRDSLYGLQNPMPYDYREPSTHPFAVSVEATQSIVCPGCPGPYRYSIVVIPPTLDSWCWVNDDEHLWLDNNLADFIQ